MNNIKECYINDKTLWENFFSKIEKCGIEDKKESIVYFQENIRSAATLNIDDFYFHLLNLYQSYPLNSDENIDGVVFRNFKKFMEKRECLRYAIGELLNEYENTYNDYPWIDMEFVFESGSAVNSFSSQEFAKNKDTDIEYTTEENRTEKIKQIGKICDIVKNDEYGMRLYREYIVPIIAGYSHPNSKRHEDLFDGLWYNDKNERQFLLSADKTKELISKFKFILCIPVYDAFVNKRLYGNFFGNITFAFKTEQEMKDFKYECMEKRVIGAEIKMIDIIKENLFLYVK